MKLCMGCMNEIEDHLSTCPYCGFNELTLRQESYYLDPGTVVGGKYIVGRVLNYGGHTVSYLGMDAESSRKVIVKEYLPSDFSTRSEGEKDVTIYSGDGQVQFEQGLTNFLNEANRIQHLQNAPGIARFYDCVAENETGYVISEYVEGKTLKEILDGGKKYTAEEAAAFTGKILQGLAGVHQMDIVHCDISPETIMVTDRGDIKLMDFGATRYVTTANSKSLSIILKRGYAPEEQYRSKGKRGPWTDVYAMGAVMYRMMTGIVPQESVERALSDDLKEPSKMGVAIPKNMENALMNALNVYQDERTPSAEAFLKELNSDNVKRIKVKQRKNKTGKFPLWAKGLVAVLACAVATGGAYVIHNMSGNNAESLKSEAVFMPQIAGKPLEEAQGIMDELNKKYEWDIQLAESGNTVFDLEMGGKIYSQGIEPGAELYDPAKAEQESIEGLQIDSEGKITGTVSYALYSNEKLRFSEISGLNAYALAQKLGIETEESTQFHGEKEEGDRHDYFDLKSIEVAGESYTAEKLKENQGEEIKYSEDIKINYYASPFFYWKKLPDFVGKNIDALPEQNVYEYKNEKDRQKAGTKPLKGSNLVKDGYYAMSSKGSVGQIVEQTVAAGEKYDASYPGDTPLEIRVIGKTFDYQGKTGQEFIDEITAEGFGMAVFIGSRGKSGDGNWYKSLPIMSVKVCETRPDGDYENADELLYFKKENESNEQSICFYITVKEPDPPKPKPAPSPSPSPSPSPAPSPAPGPAGDSHNA